MTSFKMSTIIDFLNAKPQNKAKIQIFNWKMD